MSAIEDEYRNHKRKRPGRGSSTQANIVWSRQTIAILNRIAAEQPHLKAWARNEINHEMQWIADLRTGKDS
ncbi:hypothetical protein C8D87_11756 [Lentzea atacamensis]|uniref:Uncharacterized protein n=1 Tax=Lentzea atacamensis TaxID=531938 RepID=A0ABX9DVH0_9PSEU|nr:hypothetical protein [Lentzea atacamensis]RAS58886.1 hypothetical protein C8D87_11756 [Lentzea atacamensis]